MADPSGTVNLKKPHSKKRYLLGSLVLGITIIFCAATVYYWNYTIQLQNYGYLGAFLVSLLASGTMVVPIPYVVVVFTMGGVLNPALVGAASGLGAGLGSMSIYFLGYGGSNFLPDFKISQSHYTRVINWAQRRGSLAVFIMSAVFNPLFVPMAITVGMARFRMWKFFLLCWSGNTVKSLIIAYAGYLGLRSLLRFLGAEG